MSTTPEPEKEVDERPPPSAQGKLQRTVESMFNSMKTTEEEEAYRVENFKDASIEDYSKHLKCTKCKTSFKPIINRGEVDSHPLLGVLMCEDCCEYYGDGEFSLDSEGEDKYCRWCGEGGTIFACSKCICGFCDKCIEKHFGEETLEKVKNDDDWSCYFCNPKPLWYLRSICSLAEKAAKSRKEELLKKKAEGLGKKKKGRSKKATANESESLDDSLSSSCDNIATNRRKMTKKLINAKLKTKCESSSSEDEKENQFGLRSRSKRLKANRLSKKESSDSESKIPKKRQKAGSSDDSSGEKMTKEENTEFEGKKAAMVEKLRGIWKLTEIMSEIGLDSSRKRLKKLSKPEQLKTMESLQREYQKLKSVMSVLSSSLNTVSGSVASVNNELTDISVSRQAKTLRREEVKLKKLTKKLQEDSDVDRAEESHQEGVNTDGNSNEEGKVKKGSKVNGKKGSGSKTDHSSGGKSADDNKGKNEKSSGGEKENGESAEKDEDEPETGNAVDEENGDKPKLKVKDFAKMTDDNVLKGEDEIECHDLTEEVEEEEENQENKGKKENKDNIGSEMDDKVEMHEETKAVEKTNDSEKRDGNMEENNVNEKEGDANTEETNIIEDKGDENAEENSVNDKKKNKVVENGEEKDEYNAETEASNDENDERKKEKRTKRKKKDSSGSNFSEEADEKEKHAIRRVKKQKKTLDDSFEKFRQKREKYLKHAKEKEEEEDEDEEDKGKEENGKKDNLDSSGEEEMKPRKSTRQRRRVIASSDEENEEEKNNANVSDSDKSRESEKEILKQEEESSEDSIKHKVSSGTTSEDENCRKKSRWKRIKKGRSKNKSDSSEEGESEGDEKKKGRKNIKKILKKESLHVETKEALKNEEARKKRLEERKKLFDEIFPKKEDEERDLVRDSILDFDPETKEPLVTIHKKLMKKLKPHQIEGVKFMWDNCFESVKKLEEESGSGCILAHCMGLGKTLQVVAFVHTIMNHELGVNTVLIICPLSTVTNWLSEFEMWLSNINTEPIVLYDLLKFRKAEERIYRLQDWHKTGGVMVISYDLFRNLTKLEPRGRSKKIRKKSEICLLDPGPDVVICDEGHLLKNENTALSKCVNMIKTSRRVVLTGTPLQNNLMEYHCMVGFVKPNILGTKKEFSNRFMNPIVNGQFEDSTELDVKIMKRRSYVLHSMLTGCVQRFDYSVLTPFLPKKYEYVLSISLTETQAKLYRLFINQVSVKTTGSSKTATLFNDFHNLQRIWTHPRTMLMHSEKAIKKAREKEAMASDSEGSLKDFVVDTDEEETTSTSGSSSDSVKETPPPKRRNLRSNANDPDIEEEVQVIEPEEQPAPKEWWDEFFKKEDYEDIRASNKLLVLFRLLKQCAELKDKVLVFSQSLYSLDLIEYFLKKIDESSDGEKSELLGGYQDSWVLGHDYFRLDGTTSSDVRAMYCKNFNKESNSRARLFLISTLAGGLGINLFAANRVVMFDASWNPSHDVQSIFRVYRFGQKKTCYIYRFLSEATMEEKIYERQVTKLALALRVVDEHQIERHYSMINLQELYKFDPIPKEQRKLPKLPKDDVLAELLTAHKDIIVNYHEHDSLLQNQEEEELSEEERKAAWKEYEDEKVQKAANTDFFNQMAAMLSNTGVLQQFPQNSGVVNPLMVNMAQASFGNMVGSTFPTNMIQRGIQVGITPLFNESTESFFNRVVNRERWLKSDKGPRET